MSTYIGAQRQQKKDRKTGHKSWVWSPVAISSDDDMLDWRPIYATKADALAAAAEWLTEHGDDPTAAAPMPYATRQRRW